LGLRSSHPAGWEKEETGKLLCWKKAPKKMMGKFKHIFDGCFLSIFDGKTTIFDGQTPIFDGKTPIFDGKTPIFDGKTPSPIFDGKTPV